MHEKERVAVVTLNSPKTLNALSRAVVNGINNHLINLEKDDRINSVIITGMIMDLSAANSI